MKTIILTQGKVALVDNIDFDRLSQLKWFALKGHGTWYAVRNEKNETMRTVYMHRKILNPRPGMETDHRDHNGLNNQKTNLRIVTAGQNQHNQKKHKGTTSQFKGVSWRKKMSKWQVQIMIHYNRIYLGMFTSEIQAAKAYDRAAIKYFGEFACTNFPRSDYL